MALLNLFSKKKKDEVKAENVPVSGGGSVAAVSGAATGKKDFTEGLVSTKDIIAPSAIEVDFDWIRIDNKYYRTMFVAGYPRFVGINWLSSLINFDASLNISMYIYPTDGKEILDDLRRKIAEMEAEISSDIQRGRIVNPATQAKLEDALNLQADLVKGEERFFQFGLYITLVSEEKDELNRISKNLESALGALMINSKKATLQMEEGFVTTLPICNDRLNITRNMDTTSLATTFPFVSSDLSDDKGIMYGINEHNGSMVIFDRFSMQNYNSVVFATAGAGKSYMIKLEALRSLMLGTSVIIIDPENEYRNLCEAVGGQYIAFGYGEESKINPFDLSLITEEGENALNAKVLSVHKLLKVMVGQMDPMDESILDRAVMEAYKAKGITPDPETQQREPPLIEDLYKALIGMEDQKAQMLAARLEKYIKGSFAGVFNQKTTVNLKNDFVVFGIRNLEDTLRPVAMHIVLDYIWTVIKKEMKKRILVVDEAWYLMQYEDSASFLRRVVKRGRKYYLGVTTITQDVDDFLETPYGKEIVTNSAIQILLKQHSAAIDLIGETFYLSEGEKQLLLSADKGEGIFFAGQNHVAVRVIASPEEHKLITSNPEELLKAKITNNQAPITKQLPNSNLQIPKEPQKPQESQKPQELQKRMEVVEVVKPLEINSNNQTPNPKQITNIKSQIPKESQKQEIPGTGSILEAKPTEVRFVPPTVEVLEAPATKSNNQIPNGSQGLQEPQKTQELTLSHEDELQKKIKEMEEQEKKELEEHEKKEADAAKAKAAEEEQKKKLSGSFGPPASGFGGLPKYSQLFGNKSGGMGKLPPLPPLPPLPSFPKTQITNNQDPITKQLPIAKSQITNEPQGIQKIQEQTKKEEVKPQKIGNPQDHKPTYEELFGGS